jgi:hypothetical protein
LASGSSVEGDTRPLGEAGGTMDGTPDQGIGLAGGFGGATITSGSESFLEGEQGERPIVERVWVASGAEEAGAVSETTGSEMLTECTERETSLLRLLASASQGDEQSSDPILPSGVATTGAISETAVQQESDALRPMTEEEQEDSEFYRGSVIAQRGGCYLSPMVTVRAASLVGYQSSYRLHRDGFRAVCAQ